jgi:hypothetical protein
MFVRGINCAYISKISDCIVELFHKSGIFFTLLLETGHWNRITTGRKWKKTSYASVYCYNYKYLV